MREALHCQIVSIRACKLSISRDEIRIGMYLHLTSWLVEVPTGIRPFGEIYLPM